MFLGIFTAIDTFVFIIAIFAILFWLVPNKHNWIPFLVVTLLLAWLAFKIEPNLTDDLARYYKQLDYLRLWGKDYFDRCIDENINGWRTYRVMGYYFYFCSKLSDNHYTQAIAIFIIYGSAFWVIRRAGKKFSVKKGYVFLAAMFFLSTYWYYDELSGIRNGLSFSVVITCAYFILVERKHIVLFYIGLIVACFIHSTGILIVTIVVFADLTFNYTGKYLNYLLMFGLMAGGPIIRFLSSTTNIELFDSVAERAQGTTSNINLSGQLSLYWFNVLVLVVIIIVTLYGSYYLLDEKNAFNTKRLYKYTTFLIYFVLGCVFSNLLFYRLSRFILPLIGALVFMVPMQLQDDRIKENGQDYYLYFAPQTESLRVKFKPIIILAFTIFIGFHLWYLVTGSSITWMHFADEVPML